MALEHDPAAFTEILTIKPGLDVNKSIRLYGCTQLFWAAEKATMRVLLSVVDIDFRLMESSPTTLLCP